VQKKAIVLSSREQEKCAHGESERRTPFPLPGRVPRFLSLSLSLSLFGDRRFLAATAAELAALSSSSFASLFGQGEENANAAETRAGEMPRSAQLQRTRVAKAAARYEEARIEGERGRQRAREREREREGGREGEREREREETCGNIETKNDTARCIR